MPLLSTLDRGYAFVEFEKEEDMTAAYKKVRGGKERIGGRRRRVGKESRGGRRRRVGKERKEEESRRRRVQERRGENMECTAQRVLRVEKRD
jgi:RNA recognition motif-containing protein